MKYPIIALFAVALSMAFGIKPVMLGALALASLAAAGVCGAFIFVCMADRR